MSATSSLWCPSRRLSLSSSMSRLRLPVTHSSDCSTQSAVTSLRHALRLGKILTTRVRRFISWLRRSKPLVVRMRLLWLSWNERHERHERHSSTCSSRCSATPGVVPRAGNTQDPTHQRDRKACPLRLDEPECTHRVPSSQAKKALRLFSRSPALALGP